MRRRRKNNNNDFVSGEVSEINVTPLADVSLTLVIMMMVISPMVFQSMIQVKASQAIATKTTERVKDKPLFVDITRKGYTINNKKIPNEYTLFRTLQRNLLRKNDKTVLITSASDVQYQNVVRVLDIVKQSGAENLSLVPRKKRA